MSRRTSGLVRTAMRLLRTPKGKQVGGRVLDGAARAADRVTKQRYAERIDGARRAARQGLDRL